jgi:molecular chaperone GrpE (heat shock protein)
MGSDDQGIARLGRGLVQVHTRLGRVLELLEGSRPSDDLLPTLLDAVDAMEAAADASGASVARGLRAAVARTEDALRGRGYRPVATTGPIDPLHHRVIATAPAPSSDEAGCIAKTHRTGWLLGDELVRAAHVTAYAMLPEGRDA